jgi:hypothetical protein
MNTDYTHIFNVFAGAGYQVTRLTFQDILNHELSARNYDVLVLADNCPRENISDLVREFWLGGGGILSFDSAIGYLGYAGILPREDLGVDDGLFTYWNYVTNDHGNVSARHPVTKDTQLGQQLAYSYDDYAQYDWSALMTTSIASDLTKLTIDDEDPDWAQAVAMDPTDMGGRAVQIGIPINPWASDWQSLMVNAIEWLCPRPKGRIAFDVSHEPLFSLDMWDSFAAFPSNYEDMRNLLVNHTYSIDKLYPSSQGNLTLARLSGYDMLIVAMPTLNFTASEVSAVTNWVNQGGSLFVIGDVFPGDYSTRTRINYLLSNMGLSINPVYNAGTHMANPTSHVTTEGCSSIYFMWPKGYVNISGSAQGIWYNGGDIWIGANELQRGRVILSGDSNIFSNEYITDADQVLFTVNVANWLTAAKANVLVYTDGGDVLIDPSYNFYKSPVANALDALGLRFMMSNEIAYFNLSLNTESWDLVILDQNYYGWSNGYYLEIKSYIESGGRFIGRSWSSAYVSALGIYLGFKSNGMSILAGPPTVYLWDKGQDIFTKPINYGADNITASNNYFNIDYRHYDPLANGTAAAGITQSPTGNNSAIIISDAVPAITNSFSISQYFDDTDDSTYEDGYEIFLNEIAYLLRPEVDSPADFSVEYGSVGIALTWAPTSDRPQSYVIDRNSAEIATISWDGGPISVLLDGYALGDYLFEITVYDSAGMSATDVVTVAIVDTTAPVLADEPDNLTYQEGTPEHLLNWSFTELLPDSWVLYIDGSVQDSGPWDGSVISADAGGLVEGSYNTTIAVNDTSGNTASSMVMLSVTAPPTSTTTTTTTTTETGSTSAPPSWGDSTTWILMVIAAIAVFVIIVVIVPRRRK